MEQPKLKRIIVFGGACIEGCSREGYRAKAPIAHYLKDLSRYAQETYFFAQSVRQNGNEPCYTGHLIAPGLKVQALGKGLACRWKEVLKLRSMAEGSSIILFMPNAIFLTLISAFLRKSTAAFGVYLANDFESHAKEHRFRGGSIGRWFYLYAFRSMITNAHFIIARGRRAEALVGDLSKPIHQTLPLGHLDLTEVGQSIDRCSDERKRQFLFVGKLLWRKGLGELLQAMKLLRGRHPDVAFSLTVVGDGDERAAIEALAKELELSELVNFTGWIDKREVLQMHWKAADILVMPSSLHKEGVPRVIDEALSQGLPVVATEIGGVSDEFSARGEVLLVHPADADALVDGMEKMAFNIEIRNTHIVRGRARIERWLQHKSAGHQHAQLLIETANLRAASPSAR